MKKIFTLSAIAFSIISCNSGGGDKKTELEKLKKEELEIKAKIFTLESELAIKDSGDAGISIAVETLKPAVFNNYIDVQGRVDADENVSISTEMPGTITKINVKVGDEVHIGQVLAETDSRALSQQISDLQTNADLVNQIYEKQKNLWDQKIGTEVQFLQAKTNKESMEKKMSALQEQIRMSKIISPINGTVDAVDVKVGQMVTPGMPSIRVINYSNLKVKADVSETYASKVKKNSDVIVFFPDTQDSIISKVNFVSRAINPATRTFSVEVLLDNKKEYHPNMVARLRINDYKSAEDQLMIPVRTIQKDENNASYVYVAEGNIAKKRIITLGKEYKGQAEVLTGLKEGDKLITMGYDLVNENSVVSYKK